jgi:hypothetical protein
MLDVPEAVNSFIQPETDDIMNGISNFGVLPIQVWLLRSKQVQIILIRSFIILPRTPYRSLVF